ncbi:fibronectin type III domain-containing protein [Paenibacillus luteus]|uniref:fibronectin type III domain-containing protein n=1 Tax=Paenibacillus luteus TaxID=2545753 RepID=UPI001143C8C6|nr:S-layer homology domain-containing protein [Paenibacillus luteus]
MPGSYVLVPRKKRFRSFIIRLTLFALLFTLFPYPYVAKAEPVANGKPDLLSGIPVNSIQNMAAPYLANANYATDGDDTTSTDMGAGYYNSYSLTFPSPTNIGRVRIVVNDYSKLYYKMIRMWHQDGSYTDRYLTQNTYTDIWNISNVTMIQIPLVQVVSSDDPFKLFTFEVYEMNLVPPTVPEFTTTAAGNGQVSLNWTASEDNENELAGYNIYKDGSYLAKVDGDTTGYTVTGLANNVSHTFQVSAVDASNNESAKSTQVSLMPINADVPSTPTALKGTPEEGALLLHWAANPENDIAGYNVYRDGMKVNTSLVVGSSYSFSDVIAGVSYGFQVEAVNTSGLVSAKSDLWKMVYQKKDLLKGISPSYCSPADPTYATDGDDTTALGAHDLYGNCNFVFTNGAKDIGKIRVLVDDYRKFWGVAIRIFYANNQYYDLMVNTDIRSNDFTKYVNLRGVTRINFGPNSGLTPETALKLFSFEAYAIDDVPPSVPAIVSSAVGNGHVDLTWSASTDNEDFLAGYKIYKDGQYLTSLDRNTTTYTVTGLSNKVSYNFEVSAYDSVNNESAKSAAVSLTPTNEVAPTAPTEFRGTVQNGFITLKWKANPENDLAGYNVYQDGAKLNTTPIIGESYSIKSQTYGVPYDFYVEAVNTSGLVSAESDTIRITPYYRPDLLSGLLVNYIQNVSAPYLANANYATDGDDTTSTNMGAGYYNSYSLTFPSPTNIGKVRIVVNDYSKLYYKMIRMWHQDGSYTDRYLTQNTTTDIWNISNVTMIQIPLVQVVSSDDPFKLFTFEVYEMNLVPPTVPEFTTTEAGNGEVSLNWSASMDNENELAGYNIYKDGSLLAKVDSNTASYTATGLANTKSYSFQVSAFDASNNESAKSTAVSLTPVNTVVPTAPVNVAGTFEEGAILLRWAANPENDLAGYNVYNNGVKVNATPIVDVSYSVSDVTVGTSYGFEVEAVNTSGLASAKSTKLNLVYQKPNLLRGMSPSYCSTINPTYATDGDDSTALGAYDLYGNCNFVFANGAKDIGKIRVLVDDYHKFWGVAIRIFYENNQYYDLMVNTDIRSNDFTKYVNLRGVTRINFGPNSGLSPVTALKLFSFEAYEIDRISPSIPEMVSSVPGKRKVNLEWTASTDNEGFLSGYRIYKDGQYLTSVNSATTSYTVEGLSNLVSYNFEVTAYDSTNNESTKSERVSVTPINAVAPSAPADLTGTSEDGAIALKWTANDEDDLEGYNVYKNGEKLNAVPLVEESYYIESLTNGISYDFQVEALNDSGIVSAKSDTISIVPYDTVAPSTVKGINVEVGVASGTAKLTWAANADANLQGYVVYVNGVKSNLATITDTFYLVTGLINGVEYSFQVSAANGSNMESEKSESILKTPLNPEAPAAPAAVTGMSGDHQALISWTANTESDLVEYKIYRDGIEVGVVDKNTTSFAALELPNGISTAFTVTANNTSGLESDQSEPVTVTPVSSNAALSDLDLSNGQALNSAFDAETDHYTSNVGYEVTSLTVVPTSADEAATITVNESAASEPVSLNVGSNEITIVVTAQDQTTTKTYTVVVTRAQSSNASLSGLALSGDEELNETFAAETASYTANVSHAVTSLTIVPTVADETATVLVNGLAASEPVSLNVGSNVFTVVVTAQDDKTTRSYTVTVTRAAASTPPPTPVTTPPTTPPTSPLPVTTPTTPPASPVPVSTPSPKPSSTPGVTPTAAPHAAVHVDSSANAVTTATGADGHVTTVVTQDAGKLADAFKQLASEATNNGEVPKVSLLVNNPAGTATTVKLPLSVLADAAAKTGNATIDIESNDGTYSLPLSILDFTAIAESLGTTDTNISIQVNISLVEMELSSELGDHVVMLGSAIEFSITATGNGQTIELNNFGSTYVERSVQLATIVDADHTTVALYDRTTGKYSFVPALFEEQADGTTKVTFKRNGNSIYTVLSSTKTFNDVSKHWAKADIELLASKMVIGGVNESSFAPERSITRAEFAAMLIRALGLTVETASVPFTDVKEGSWYAGAIGAAVKAGLIAGFTDGTFRPNESITREQMAVMAARAASAAGMSINVSGAENELLANFQDKSSIGSWSQASVAKAVKANIITGITKDTFDPAANATRAQAAVMLKRLMQYAHFIN